MSDDFVLKMYETQAELIEAKQELSETQQELKRIRKEHEDLKNQMAADNLMKRVDNFQTKFSKRLENLSLRVSTIEELITVSDSQATAVKNDLATLSGKVSNYDDIFSELNENLRQISKTLTKNGTILNQHDETQAKQNKTTPFSNASENDLVHFEEKKTILLLGGKDEKSNDSLLMLENNGQEWKELNIKLPYTLWFHGAQFLNNNLYIFGGSSKRTYLNCTYKVSKSLQWEKMADMNQRRSHISNSSVILNNKIWVCGGRSLEPLKSVEMYDPLTNKWKYMKEMNENRRDAAVAVVNGKIFCSGGYYGSLPLSSVECYDPSSNVWTRVCNMPQNIVGHGAVEIDGHFIIMGGIGGWKNVWALDAMDKNAKWIKKPSMSSPRWFFSIAKIDNKIFVCGGVGSQNNIEIFDGEVWSDGPKMPTTRESAPAVVIPAVLA